jgi:hypothetical protein
MKLLRKSILPIAAILLIAVIGQYIYVVNGQVDWFWFCMVFGVPFGIPYMTIIVPMSRKNNISSGLAVMAVSAIIGAVFGAVIAAVVLIKAVAYLLWFIVTSCKRLIFG